MTTENDENGDDEFGDMGSFFSDAGDPENPGDPGIDQESLDKLIDSVTEAMRKIGLYGMSFAYATPQEDQDIRRLGVISHTDDPRPLIMMGAFHIGDLAWTRVQSEKEQTNDQIIRMEHGILESEVEEIRRRYQQDQPDE